MLMLEFLISVVYYYGKDMFGELVIVYNINNCGIRMSLVFGIDFGGLGYSMFCGCFDFDVYVVEVFNQLKFGGVLGNDCKVNFVSFNVSYDFGLFKLILLIGYIKVDQQCFIDFIGCCNGILFLVMLSNIYVNFFEQFGLNINNKDFSEEI